LALVSEGSESLLWITKHVEECLLNEQLPLELQIRGILRPRPALPPGWLSLAGLLVVDPSDTPRLEEMLLGGAVLLNHVAYEVNNLGI
jgi:hypothetical protein